MNDTSLHSVNESNARNKSIPNGNGVYKLIFILPIFQHTKRILLLDFKDDDLISRLSSMGIDVCCREFSDDSRIVSDENNFDFIIAGRLPDYFKDKNRFLDNIVKYLKKEGYLISVFSNSLGFSSLLGRVPGRNSGVRPEDSRQIPREEGVSLIRGLKSLRDLGFVEAGIFAPVPNISNPTAFISLKESNSLRFLLSYFPAFRKKKSFLTEVALKLLVGSNCYKYLLNQYVIVSSRVR